jgi:hypothetical protein
MTTTCFRSRSAWQSKPCVSCPLHLPPFPVLFPNYTTRLTQNFVSRILSRFLSLRALSRALQLKESQMGKKLWERLDYSSTMAETRRAVEAIEPAFLPSDRKRLAAAKKLQASTTASVARDRRNERESLFDLLPKKREILQLQLGLEHKRQEITRLRDNLEARESALVKAEEILEEDAINFDTFYRNNDSAAVQAVRKADASAASRAEKNLELKRVRIQIASVAAESIKTSESLEQYTRFAEYLDSLTPPEWFQAAEARQQAKRDALRKEALDREVGVWEELKARKLEELNTRFLQERAAALRRGKPYTMPDVEALAQSALPSRPRLSDIPVPQLSEEDMVVPMYFTRTEQLKQLFVELEEDNIFLIQQCADLEQALEEIQMQQRDTDAAMVRANAALAESVAQYEGRIREEEAKAEFLRGKAGVGSSGEGASGGSSSAAGGAGGSSLPSGSTNIIELIQPQLRRRVVDIYQKCGFKASASSDVISMLTGMEAKLETLLARMIVLDPKYVAGKVKEKERERRTRVMTARKAKEAKLHELRLAGMLQRALVPPPKRTGRPVMYRSLLPKKEEEVEEESSSVVEERKQLEEEARFF